MTAVNIAEFRSNLRKYLSQVESGQSIHILSHGREIARLLPPESQAATAKETLRALRRRCVIGDVVSPLEESWDVLDDHS